MTAHILVVDDEPDLEALIVQRFRQQIRAGNFTFTFAEDGVSALAKLAAAPDIDMVVTDINMPRMDGLTLLGKLQEREDSLATIIVSAYGDMSNIRTAMNRGAFDFLTKPMDFADFETTLAKTLRNLEISRGYQRRQREAERAHAQLARYFSPTLADRLAATDAAVNLGAQRRDVTVMFTDITGFTTLAESLEPALIEELLNDYLTGMTETVFAHGGTLLKIIGDALNVLFGAPADQPDHAAQAVACAMALDEYAEGFRVRWQAKGIAFGATRIGIHSGPALVGNFGSGRYFDYTAYGDTINIAARLEGANKRLGTRICVSEAVVARMTNFRGRPVGHLILRGRHEALPAHEPLIEARHADSLCSAYRDAFAKAETKDPTALSAFAALLGQASQDGLVSFHLKRLLDGATGVLVALD